MQILFFCSNASKSLTYYILVHTFVCIKVRFCYYWRKISLFFNYLFVRFSIITNKTVKFEQVFGGDFHCFSIN